MESKQLLTDNSLRDTESDRKVQLTVRVNRSQFELIEEIEEKYGVSKAKAVRMLLDSEIDEFNR